MSSRRSSQGRQAHVHDVQAVVEILAEVTFTHHLLQVAVRCRYDAHVDVDRIGRADRPNLVFLQHAQQLHLQAHRHVADLVEQQGAALGGLEQAFVGARGAGKRAFDVAEEFRLEQVLGHRAAVDRDERSVLPRARAMDRARKQFLAGAALARDQNTRIGHRDHLCLRHRFLEFLVAGDDFGRPVLIDFNGRRDFHRALDRLHQLVLVDRFRQETEGAALRRGHGVRNRAVCSNDDDPQAG